MAKNICNYYRNPISLGLNILGEYASAKFILQDSRYLGNVENNPGVTVTTSSPFLHQAYFTFSNLKIPFFDYEFVKVGRFELALGNQRLIAKNNWNNIGRSFEGFLGKDSFLSGELLLMHLFISETMNESHDDQDDVVIDGYIGLKLFHLWRKIQFMMYIFSISEIWIFLGRATH